MAIRAYNSPGVVVTETTSPAVSPTLATPSLLAIVGESRGYQTATERLELTGTTAQALLYTGVNPAQVSVKLALTGETLNAGNYVLTAGTDPDSTITGDEPYTIARFGSPTGTITAVTASTGLTGTYKWAASFVNASGQTGIGGTSAPLVLANQGANLSAIPLGATGTTARNVFRMKTAGTGELNVWRLVGTIPNNTVTTFSDTVADGTAEAAAQPVTDLATGDTVLVTYQYTNQFYYEPTIFDDFDDVIDKYGPAFDAEGLVSSKLSFAVRLAFINGATEVVCVSTDGTTATDYEEALLRLLNEEDVRIVVATNGTSTVNTAIATHVNSANSYGRYRIGVIGRDGATTSVTAGDLRAAAESLNNEAVRLVSPSRFVATNSVSGKPLTLGGEYMAAAVGGMYAARDVQIPLTRKNVSGFAAISDKRTILEQVSDSNAGLLVIEDKRNAGILRVRHDITTAVGAVNTRESSVIRAKYEMAHRIKDTLDTGVIGQVVPRNEAPLFVRSAVASILGQLYAEEVIAGYTDLKARALNDPTVIEVKFGYNPVYPINNVEVRFTINTNTGEFTIQG